MLGVLLPSRLCHTCMASHVNAAYQPSLHMNLMSTPGAQGMQNKAKSHAASAATGIVDTWQIAMINSSVCSSPSNLASCSMHALAPNIQLLQHYLHISLRHNRISQQSRTGLCNEYGLSWQYKTSTCSQHVVQMRDRVCRRSSG